MMPDNELPTFGLCRALRLVPPAPRREATVTMVISARLPIGGDDTDMVAFASDLLSTGEGPWQTRSVTLERDGVPLIVVRRRRERGG